MARVGGQSLFLKNRLPVVQHRLQRLLDGIQRTPTRILANFLRAAKDDFFVRGTHQPGNRSNFRFYPANRIAVCKISWI